jgi:hypothetical protein
MAVGLNFGSPSLLRRAVETVGPDVAEAEVLADWVAVTCAVRKTRALAPELSRVLRPLVFEALLLVVELEVLVKFEVLEVLGVLGLTVLARSSALSAGADRAEPAGSRAWCATTTTGCGVSCPPPLR